MDQQTETENCSFFRRMGAVLYDSLLLFAVLLFATIPVLAITGGEAIDPGNSIFRAYVLLISFLYFIVPWKLKGQTLGMQSWKIKLVQETGELITWGQAVMRILFSSLSWIIAGLGFFWSLFDSEKRTWHDRLSSTVLIYFGKIK